MEEHASMTLQEALAQVPPGWRHLVQEAWAIIQIGQGSLERVTVKRASLSMGYHFWNGSVVSLCVLIGRIKSDALTACMECGQPGERCEFGDSVVVLCPVHHAEAASDVEGREPEFRFPLVTPLDSSQWSAGWSEERDREDDEGDEDPRM